MDAEFKFYIEQPDDPGWQKAILFKVLVDDLYNPVKKDLMYWNEVMSDGNILSKAFEIVDVVYGFYLGRYSSNKQVVRLLMRELSEDETNNLASVDI